MTIIVLEGPDFAGKTTLARSVRDAELEKNPEANVVIVHNGQPPEGVNLFGHYVTAIQKAASVTGALAIFDRLHVGEVIYGPIYRGDSQLSLSQVRAVDEMLDDLGALKIFVDAADADLMSRFRGDRGDDLVNDENTLLRIADEYRTIVGQQHGLSAHGALAGWTRWTSAHTQVARFDHG